MSKVRKMELGGTVEIEPSAGRVRAFIAALGALAADASRSRPALEALPAEIADHFRGNVVLTIVGPAGASTTFRDDTAEDRPSVGTHAVTIPLGTEQENLGSLSVRRGDAPFDTDELTLLQAWAHAVALSVRGERAEAALGDVRRELAEARGSEALLRSLLESAPDAMLIVGTDGRIVLVNAQTERQFGYSRSELLGMAVERLVPERFRARHPAHRSGYAAAAKTRPMGAGLDLYALRKDGTEFPAEISLSPSDMPDGTFVTAAIRDTTEQKLRREEEARIKSRGLEEENLRMQEANRLKSEFLANMSHELRTPLNAIIGFSELMHRGRVGELAPAHKEYMGDILASSKHLLRLINDVLDLAKVEAGKMEFRPEPVDLSRLVQEVRDIVRGLATQKRLRLETVIADIGPVVIDSSRVKQILYNYLSNAIKFTPENGTVTVHVDGDGDENFRIDVSDTGIGISDENVAKLFIEFQQLDASAAKRYQGTGLGLALTKRIAEAHGGRVEVRSTPGLGSTFSAILPRRSAPRGHDG